MTLLTGLAIPDTITISVPKKNRVATKQGESVFLSMYPHSPNLVFLSKDGVPPEWQYGAKYLTSEPVGELYIEDGLLRCRNLTNQPISDIVSEFVGKRYTLGDLMTWGYLTDDMVNAAIEVGKHQLEMYVQLTQKLIDKGFSVDEAISMLDVESSENEHIRKSLLGSSSIDEETIDVEKTVVDEDTSTDIDGESVDDLA